MASQPMIGLAARPLRPPLTLTSLPAEILSMIGRLIDKPTSLSLARVSPMFTLAVESGIWENLDLFLPPYLTDPIPIRAYFRRNGAHDPNDPTFVSYYHAGDDAHMLAIQQHVLGIMKRAETRHWHLVKGVRVVPRTGTLEEVLALLRHAGPTLLRLEIDPPHCHDYSSDWDIDAVFSTSGLHFPSLTHVRLGDQVITNDYLIPFLCNAAPNLLSLDLSINYCISDPDDLDVPVFKGTTKLKSLLILFSGDGGGAWVEHAPEPVVLELLNRIPSIEELSLGYSLCSSRDVAYKPVTTALKTYGQLRDLRLQPTRTGYAHPDHNGRLWRTVLANEDMGTGEMSVRRLVLGPGPDWEDVFINLPSLPLLETMYIFHESGFGNAFRLPAYVPFPDRRWCYVNHHLDSVFAAQLRRCPLLSVIQDISPLLFSNTPDLTAQLDEIDQAADKRGFVRSIQHGEHEMLHVGLWGSYQSRYSNTMEWEWTEYYSDLDGVIYPLEVIQEMKEVEGGGAEYWERRGAMIGKKAWKVLTDWNEGMEWSCVNAYTGEWEETDRG